MSEPTDLRGTVAAPKPNDILAPGFEPLSEWQTYRETIRQPLAWTAWGESLVRQLADVHEWLQASTHEMVWFCGAGSSANIGESLASHLNAGLGRWRYHAVPSTDLVARPQQFFAQGRKLLVVSFGRSGDSSESVGTLEALDKLAPEADRLHITCNPQGALSWWAHPGPGRLLKLLLPDQTHDAGFAMTSSYTTMLLTALACFDRCPPAPIQVLFSELADAAHAQLLHLQSGAAAKQLEFTPCQVFLGSGPLLGVARESALKVLELTAGRTTTFWDTPLGFRHGPKACMVPGTQARIFISSDPHAQRYELDLVEEMRRDYGDDCVRTTGPEHLGCDVSIPCRFGDGWNAVLYALHAQLLGICNSRELGLNVDNPFARGDLTRVVRGVTLYPIDIDRGRGR